MTLQTPFSYHRPETPEAAAQALIATDGARPLAGGTDLLPNLRRGLGQPTVLVDLSRIESLRQLSWEGNRLQLGAALPLEILAADPAVQSRLPALTAATLAVAGPSHRSAATLGGNLCQETRCVFYNQSEWWRRGNDYCLKYCGDTCHIVSKSDRCYATYHGDIAPVLMALGAEARVVGPDGERRLPLADLYAEDGSAHLTLGPGELLAGVDLEWDPERHCGYDKARVRDAIDFPLAGVAVALKRDGDRLAELRVAVTGTNSAPLMVDLEALQGETWDEKAAATLAAAIRKRVNVLKTTAMSPKYRRRVVMAMAKRLVDRLWEQAA